MIISIQKKIYSNSKQSTYTRKGVQAFSVSMLAIKAMNTLTASPGNHTSYVKKNGDLWSTGKNDEGQIGVWTNVDVDTPTIVSIGGFGVVSLGAGIGVSLGNTWAGVSLGGPGSVSLGNGVFGVSLGGGVLSLNPGHNEIGGNGWGVSLGESGFWISKVAIGGGHTIFVHRESFSKNAYLSGRNSSGQLGNGNQTPRNGYAYGLSGVRDAAAGDNFSLFLKEDGSLLGTGGNEYGQLGLGHENNQSTPQMIVSSGVQRVSAGFDHAFYIKSDGSLWGMGRNDHGQLGTGDQVDRNQSVLILPSGISQVSAGKDHTLIVKTDGSLWAMGKNDLGQLGTGDTNIRLIPTRIEPDGVKQASAGLDHSLYVKWNGSLRGMGYDDYGELGRASPASLLSPTELVASEVEQVSAGRQHTHYLKRDGTLWGMGSNTAGSLGTGDKLNKTSAVQIDTNVARLADFPFPDPYWRKLVAPDGAGSDYFGNSVSVSGNIMVVGANQADHGGQNETGAAYVYGLEDNGSTRFVQKLTSPHLSADDRFGISVSLSEKRLLVGSYWSNPNGLVQAGATYLYQVETNGAVTYSQRILPADLSASDNFGVCVSQSQNILAIGAYGSDPGGTSNAGAAYLFRVETNGSITELDKVFAADKGANDLYGYALANSNELLVVGSKYHDTNGNPDQGAAYVYRIESDGTATFLHKLAASNGATLDQYGFSISLEGKYFAIGSPLADSNANSDSGAVHLYRHESNGSSTFLEELTSPEPDSSDDRFGHSLSQSGDLLSIGAYQANGIGANYLYRIESNGSTTFLQKITAADGVPSNYFGLSNSITPNYLTVGATGSDPNGKTDAGAAYVFKIGPSNDPPADLNATGVLTIAENQPIGSVVGEFNATDPDVGTNLTYHLASGAGDTHNALFTLDANGTLETNATFDFESNASSYSIRVQAKDDLNATVEGNFTVTLTDVDDPPVVANPIGTVAATQNDANTTIDLTNVFNDQDNNNASITKSAVSSNPSLVTAGVSGNALTLDYQTDKNGTATVTVTANSNSREVNATFLVAVANIPLSVSSNSPTGQTAGLDPTLTIVFSESIQAGSGNVQLFSTSPENLEETFDVASSPNLTFSGNTLTIDPSITLTSGKTYNVRFDSGAVVEAGNGDGWGGLATPSTWNFIANATPVITSAASANSIENQLSAYMITASDAESNAITYGITGGADQAKFLINSSTGALTWQSAPDFEAPTDVGGTNTYEVTVSATDGFSTATLAVTVSVTDDGSEDTDNDKFLDGEETVAGSNSTDPNVTPLDVGMEAF